MNTYDMLLLAVLVANLCDLQSSFGADLESIDKPTFKWLGVSAGASKVDVYKSYTWRMPCARFVYLIETRTGA